MDKLEQRIEKLEKDMERVRGKLGDLIYPELEGNKPDHLPDAKKKVEEELGHFHESIREMGGCFNSLEAVEHELLRRESMAKRWKPENMDDAYYWSISHKEALRWGIGDHVGFYESYFIGNIHPTRECAQSWGEKFAPAFEFLIKEDE